MNVSVAIAATVTVTTKVTFGEVRKRFSGYLVNEREAMAAGAKWDSEAEKNH